MIAKDIKELINAVPGDGTITDTIYALLTGMIKLDGYIFVEVESVTNETDA